MSDARAAVAPIAAETDGRQGAAYRWYVLVVLFLIAIVNSMDRHVVPALAEPLKAEFHLSDSEFGFLAGLVYAVSYTVCGIPLGLMVDRVSRARMLACLVSIWGGATLLMGTVTSFMGLVLARMGVAGAESGGNSTSVSLLADYFPPKKRATAIGVFYSANGIAAFLAFALAGWIAATYGWRIAFFCVGAPGVILGLLAFFTLSEPKRGAFDPPTDETAAKPKPGFAAICKTMVSNKAVRYLVIAAIFSVFGVTGLSAFTASFYYRIHGLSLAQAGLVTGLVMGGAYALGAILGGFCSDLASRRSVNGGIYLVAAATLLAAPFAVGGLLTPSLVLSIVLIFIFKMLVGAFYGATFAGFTHSAPVAMRGAIVTFVTLLMNLVGAGGGPQAAGLLSDMFSNAGYDDPLKWSLVVICSAFVVSAGIFVLAARHMKPSDSPA